MPLVLALILDFVPCRDRIQQFPVRAVPPLTEQIVPWRCKSCVENKVCELQHVEIHDKFADKLVSQIFALDDHMVEVLVDSDECLDNRVVNEAGGADVDEYLPFRQFLVDFMVVGFLVARQVQSPVLFLSLLGKLKRRAAGVSEHNLSHGTCTSQLVLNLPPISFDFFFLCCNERLCRCI